MRYTNFILTVIAILLFLHLAKPMILPTAANASSKVMSVNIVEVGGKRIYQFGSTKGIPVVIIKNEDK